MMERLATIWLCWLLGVSSVFAQNPYYDHGSFPSQGTLGSSAAMRAELDLIEAGFAKLPTFSGNANKVVVVNSSGTALTATDAPIPSGTAFPSSPSTNALFLILDDVTAGDCDSSGGSVASLCRWNGSSWEAISSAAGSSGLTAVLAVDRIDGDAVSQATALKVGSAAASAYVVTFYDAVDGLVHTCEISGVLNDCNRAITLLAGKFWQIKKAGVVKWEIDSDGNLTEGAINVETAGVTLTTTEEQWWDVAACQNTTPSLVWNVPTANAPAAACDTGSNTQKGYASFDAATDESFEMDWVLPTGFTGAIDVHFVWKTAATSGAVGWCAQLIRVADGSTSDPAYPAQAAGNCVSDTAKGTTLQENHATITGVTCTSCVARDHVYVRISRDANGGAVTDDMTGDAHLMKVGRTWRIAK